MRRRTSARVAALTVAAALVAACGDDDSGGAGGEDGGETAPTSLEQVGSDLERFETYLAARPGVADATVEQVELDTDYYSWQGTVTLAADAAPESVADTLEAASGFDARSTLDEPGELTLTREGTEHQLWWQADAETALPDLFVLAEERLPDLPWVLDDHGQFRVAALRDAQEVADVAAQVAAEPGLAEHGWLLTTTEFPEVVANDGTRVLQADALEDSTLAAWREAADATTALQELQLDVLQLVTQNPPGSYTSDPPPEGSMALNLALDAGGADAGALDRGPLAEELRDLVEATVPALGSLPHGSTYSLSAWVGGEDGRSVDLLDLTSDREDAGQYDDTLAGFAQELLDRAD